MRRWLDPIRMWRRASLRWQFALIGLSVLAPLILLNVHFGNAQRARAVEGAGERASQLAARAVESLESTAAQARELLAFLDRNSEVQSGGELCDAHLRAIRQLHPWITEIRLSDLEGNVICADRPEIRTPNIGDRAYFQSAIKSDALVISDITVGSATGSPSLFAAYPHRKGGTMAGIISLGIDLEFFGTLPGATDPGEAVAFILDSEGGTVAQSPARHGRPAPRRGFAADHASRTRVGGGPAGGEPILAALKDPDGVERIFAFRLLPHTSAVIAVGIDKASVVGPVDADLRASLLLIGAIIGISVATGIAGGEFAVFRPLRALTSAAHALEAGHPAQVRIRSGGEVANLASAITRMARAVANRERRLAEAEAAAREANRLLVLAEQLARVGHWRIEVPSRKLAWSEGAFRIYGLDPAAGEPTVEAAIECYHPDDRSLVHHCVHTAIATGEGYTVASRLMRPDGSTRHVISRGMCEFDAAGAVKAVFGVLRDITDIRKAEQQLEAILDNMDQGLVVVDADRRIPVCNRRAIELLDLPAELMASKPLYSDVVEYQRARGEFEPTDKALQIFLASDGLHAEHHVFERSRPNGTVLEIRTAPLGNGGAVRTYTDVTARRKAERAIQESEARFRLLANHATDMIVRTDLQGVREYVSPACQDMLGYEPEELIGQRPETLIHPDDRDGVAAVVESLACGESGRAAATYRIRHKNGEWVWVEAHFQLVRAVGTGAPASVVSTVRDITERHRHARELQLAKQAAEEAQIRAEQANEAKTDFLATMSHEIRTPLNGVLGYTDLLLDEAGLTPTQRRYAERIQTAGSSLLAIVDDILDFSAIETGEVELHPLPFSPEALADNALSIVRGIAERKRLAVSSETIGTLPGFLVGDEARLRQVLLNLLNNAVKFTYDGQVTLRIRHEGSGEAGESLRFEVQDTGIGIPAEKTDRLFKRFSQVDGSIKREFGGTGLGLAISQRLVSLMGGEIGIASEEGVGSVFWFTVTLPRAQSPAPSPEPQAVTVRRTGSILLAEDLEVNQEIARAVLEAAGHEVDVVSDGAEAVMAVQAKVYDLVLMDVQMPLMDGVTATRRIRALPAPLSEVPIVAMTANVLQQQIGLFKQAGMNGHVGKPFKREELFRTVDRWISRDRSPALLDPGGYRLSCAAFPEDPRAPADPVSCDGRDPGSENPSRPQAFDGETFEALRSLMGNERAFTLLDRLGERLTCFDDPAETPEARRRLAREAHALVSSAGMLGFPALSHACTDLERACNGNGSVEDALRHVRAACGNTLVAIASLKQAA